MEVKPDGFEDTRVTLSVAYARRSDLNTAFIVYLYTIPAPPTRLREKEGALLLALMY